MRRYISKEIHHNASCYVCLSILLLCLNATLQLNATKVLKNYIFFFIGRIVIVQLFGPTIFGSFSSS